MQNKIFIVFFLIINISFGQEKKEIAIIFDGIPIDGIEISPAYTLEFNYELTRVLDIMKISSVGFVNEMRIAEPLDSNIERRKAVLQLWTKNNLTIGNYTYSRLDPNKVSFKEYKEDIEKGDIFSNEYLARVGKKVHYFRFPFEGEIFDKKKKKKILDLLEKKNYTIIPKTISNDDEIFDVCYLKSKSKNDTVVSEYIMEKYLSHTTKVIEFYEKKAEEIAGGYFPQVLSLHMNLINVQNLPYIVSLLQSKGYKIVNLNKIINSDPYLNLKKEDKIKSIWTILNNNKPIKGKIKIPIVIEKLYENQKGKYHILE